jgi:nitrite reductase/ring-hydroxylating ferredoxin subunit
MLSSEENQLLTRVGPGTPMGRLFRRFWLPAMLALELPEPDGPPARLRLLGEDLVAYRDSDGRIGVLGAHCPHRGASLFFGRNEDCGLRCVYHGWKFDLDGRCVDMPNEPPESNFKDKIHHLAYPAHEAGRLLWVYMGPPELQPELPQLEFTLVPDDHVYAHKRIQDCSWLQNVEGEVDSSHISFLHRDQRLAGALPGFVFQEGAPRFTVLGTDYGLLIGAQRRESDTTDYWRLTQFLLPSYTMIPTPPDKFVDFTAAIPIDDEHMVGFTVAWRPDRPLSAEDVARIESWNYVYSEVDPRTFVPVRNRGNDYQVDRALQRGGSYTGIKGVRDQDAAVQEGMGPIVDRSAEHLGSADAAVIHTRRLLLKLLADLDAGREPYAVSHPEAYRVRSATLSLPAGAPFDETAAAHSRPLAPLV